jgi:DNA-binding MarR family transcriptional regulator
MHLTGRSVFPSQKELAEHLGITPAAVTGALKKLEEDGYIERTSGSDSRYNEIKISDAGKAVVKETEKMFSEIDARIFSGFTENEIAEFIELNLKIQNNIRLVTDGGESKK